MPPMIAARASASSRRAERSPMLRSDGGEAGESGAFAAVASQDDSEDDDGLQFRDGSRRSWLRTLTFAGGLCAACVLGYLAIGGGPSDQEELSALSAQDGPSSVLQRAADHIPLSPFGTRNKWSFLRPDPELLRWDVKFSPKHMPEADTYIGGWLSVPLIHDPYMQAALRDAGEVSPRLCLRVTARPALTQPSVNGPLLFHCGGPGSGRSCVTYVATDNSRLKALFDSWSIDQRGISLFTGNEDEDPDTIPPCPFAEEGTAVYAPHLKCHDMPEDNATIFRMLALSEYEQVMAKEVMNSGGEIFDRSKVEMQYRLAKLHANLCYTAKRFRLQGQLLGGGPSNRTYNFLKYVSTTDLVHDVEIFRTAVGAEAMSINGFSYGTMVSSLYGTLYPHRSSRLIANGVVTPYAQKKLFASGAKVAYDTVWSGIVQACDKTVMTENPDPGSICPAAPRVSDKFRAGASVADFLRSFAQITVKRPQNYGALLMACLDAPDKDLNVTACEALGNSLQIDALLSKAVGRKKPKSERDDEFPFEGTPQSAILALDLEGVWSTDVFMREWDRQKGSGYPVGLIYWTVWATYLFSWPVTARPIPPLTSTKVPLVVIGNLFDGQTSYNWAQEMRNNFPAGSMVTWQGWGHCFTFSGRVQESVEDLEAGKYTEASARMLCERLISDYLVTGHLPPDGHTCEAPRDLQLGPDAYRAAMRTSFRKCKFIEEMAPHVVNCDAILVGAGEEPPAPRPPARKAALANETEVEA
eukprot:TRINITY_DN54295_c0_g1_i1.p1 TRINITY_DN54295_c0_g1~~TRINITY_DN54295_c0_g1_i1.p1  ORF type:complete len:778 (+),score=176.72 TRINITY_DN54295_c0_g1_i1:75-2336(+)